LYGEEGCGQAVLAHFFLLICNNSRKVGRSRWIKENLISQWSCADLHKYLLCFWAVKHMYGCDILPITYYRFSLLAYFVKDWEL